MSVASELELLAGAKEDIAAAISEKGGTAPAGLVGYADVIRKLPCSLDSLPINDEEASWCIFLNCDGDFP